MMQFSKKKQKWLLAGATAALLVTLGLFWMASRFAAKYQPYIKEQVIAYLERKFDSEVELADLRLKLPNLSPVRIFFKRGRGVLGTVTGKDLIMRHKGRRDLPPLFAINGFRFELDLGTLLDSPRRIPLVVLDGMRINIPPKGERPEFNAAKKTDESKQDQDKQQENSDATPKASEFIVSEVLINNGHLALLPKSADRFPLEFELYRLQLNDAGIGQAMKYTASMTNPKPPGKIASNGTFGPWNTETPGDTPLKGAYELSNADLGVFSAIAGILHSTGTFEGTLSSLAVHGEATVPDFRLKKTGNPMNLRTRFEAEVDGTNGDTILKPVRAILGTTEFTTAGAVLKHEVKRRRAITLNVIMPKGHLKDLLRLAVKGADTTMDGDITMKSTIEIPPEEGKVSGKLILDGDFLIAKGQFKDSIQDKIDELSRRGQGQPKNQEIDEVFSRMKGAFHMEDAAITLRGLTFSVPGADVNLDGTYDTAADELDFRGNLKLDAKVSQTLTGWKRWLAKPADPFFAKNGAGTYLPIAITGKSHAPKFGLAKGKGKEE